MVGTGCSVPVNNRNLGSVQVKQSESTTAAVGVDTGTPYSGESYGHGNIPVANRLGEKVDGDAEQDISTKSLIAWRTATSHLKQGTTPKDAWEKQRAADEKLAMAQLKEIQKSHPGQSTVLFMMGQVQDHFGKHEEAIKYFKAASEKNLVSSMTIFKLAESERKAGRLKEGAADYRKLLQVEPHFSAGELGLAGCLIAINPHDPEAVSLLREVLTENPKNEEAQALLKKTGAPP